MRKQRLLIPVLILAAAGLAAFGGRAMASYSLAPDAGGPLVGVPSAAARLGSAWQNARTVGKYAYSTEIAQTTHPTARFENQGLSSKTDNYRIDGAADLPAQTMNLKIWTGAGSADAASEALEVRVADGKSFGRNDGGAWRELDDASAVFDPKNDPLTYLVAAKNVADAGEAASAGIRYTRYTFDLDGPAFAEYMRGRMDDELRRKGKLPATVNTSLLRQYVQMTGAGELWVSEIGLPLRQTVRLRFPPQGLEWVDAELSTDFSEWGDGRLALGVGLGDASVSARAGDLVRQLSIVSAAELSRAATLIAIALIVVACLILLTRHGGSRRIYRAVVLSIITAMLCGPLLQTQQAVAFVDDQRAQTARVGDQRDSETQRALGLAALNANDFDANTAPLTAAAQRDEAERRLALARSDRDALTGAPVSAAAADTAIVDSPCRGSDGNADPDGDGLTNAQEDAIGAGPCDPDSDDDGIPDGVEVVGFDVGGHHLYLNPLVNDSDQDGLADGIECADLQMDISKTTWAAAEPRSPLNLWKRQSGLNGLTCADNDHDGIPDVWDEDSDGDGVPDTVDLAPTTVLAGRFQSNGVIDGFSNQVFNLSIANPTPDKPLVVELQLRPANPDHLFLRQNVLDWAKDDRKGQVERVFSNPYGASGKDANGNMRMIPMLEVQINPVDGKGDGLPLKVGAPSRIYTDTPLSAWLDTEALDSFGISVKKRNDKGDLLVYTPINVVRDSVGTKPVAFAATLFYRPGAGTFATEQVRLVWLVQAKTDYCDTSSADPKTDDYDKWCAGTAHWKTVENQTIHSYYDDWYLTGMSIREDLGVKIGVVFENDAFARAQSVPASAYYEDKLWALADNLDDSFMAGREEITIDEIQNRFDVDSNLALSGTAKLWGFAQNTFRVKTYSIPSQSLVGVMAMTNTPALLNAYFSPTVAFNDAPTLLFAREETFRAAAQSRDGQIVDNSEKFELSAAALPSQTVASLSWAPYHWVGARLWEPYPVDAYLARLKARVAPIIKADAVLNEDNYAFAGSMLAVDGLYAGRLVGSSVIRRIAGKPVIPEEPKNDAALAAAGVITGYGGKLKTIIGVLGGFEGTASRFGSTLQSNKWLKSVGKSELSTVKGNFGKLKDFALARNGTSKLKRNGAIAAAAAIVVGLVIFHVAASSNPTLTQRVDAVLQSAVGIGLAAYSTYGAYKSVKAVYDSGKTFSAAAKAAPGYMKKIAKATAVIGLVIGVGVGVAMFFSEKNGSSFGSQAYDDAIVNLVATIIVAVIMFAIAFIPIVGELILAVFALLDVLADGICKALGVKADPKGNGAKDWLCGGLTGLLTKAIAKFIFSSNPIINMDAANRRVVGAMQQDLEHPEKGFQQGNAVRVSFKITSTLVANEPNSWMAHIYDYQYKGKYLRQSDFKYELQVVDADIHGALETDNQHGYWRWNGSSYETVVTPTVVIPLTRAGLNQDTRLRIAEGYAINLQKCVYVIFSVACWLTDKKETNGVPVNDMLLDVFPATLEQFYALTSRGNDSYALKWDAQFPTLCDADGDGLRSKACAGGDPDDANPDSDHDGLSDFDEVTIFHTNPLQADTDGDGLTDYQEARLGANPLQADTDGDGLLDCEEAMHVVVIQDPFNACGAVGAWSGGWSLIYGFDALSQPLRTQVVPNLKLADTDGDGLLDNKEKLYGWNPRVISRGDILSISAEVYENGIPSDGYVRPGQTLTYTARLENGLNNRFGQGLLDVVFPAALTSVDLLPKSFVLQPSQVLTLAGSVTVDPAISQSQDLTLTNRAGAEITNLYGDKDGRVQWLHFDATSYSAATGATIFPDSSGKGAYGQCAGTCPVTGTPGYIANAARFGDALNQFINLGNPATLGLYDSSFTVAAWISLTAYVSSPTEPASVLRVGSGNSALSLKFADGHPAFSSDYLERQCIIASWGCSNVSIHKEVVVPTQVALNQWHQVGYRYDKARQEVTIFIDGRADAVLAGVPPILLGSPALAGYGFKGAIDELEVFNRALADSEIGARFAAPVLQARFDGDLKDASPYNQAVTPQGRDICQISFSYCEFVAPAIGLSNGVLGGALTLWNWHPGYALGDRSTNDGTPSRFSSVQELRISPNASLDLKDGHFTQAFWINPNLGRFLANDPPIFLTAPENSRIGVLGAEYPSALNDDGYHYPFVELVGATRKDYDEANAVTDAYRVRVGFSAACAKQTAGFIVGDGQWSHLVVSFNNGVYTLYQNGILVDTLSLPGGCAAPSPIGNPTALLVGRSRGSYIPPLFVAPSSVTVTFYTAINYGGTAYAFTYDQGQEPLPRRFHDAKSFKVSGTCVTLYDDPLGFWKGASQRFCSDTPTVPLAFTNRIYSFAMTPRARAFNGKLDDLRVYRSAFNADDALDLYNSAIRRLELSLDEAPGATRFRDNSFAANAATCSVGRCPVSGLQGRVNQAARFDGLNDVLEVGQGAAISGPGSFAVGAWVKTASAAYQVIAKQGNAFDLTMAGGRVSWGVSGVDNGNYGGYRFVSPLSINDNAWHHVMGTRQSDGTAIIYIDGVSVASNPEPLYAVTASTLSIGGDAAANTGFFNGTIDNVTILNKAPEPGSGLRALLAEAPNLSMHLDDDAGARNFVDASRQHLDGLCFGVTCPQTGAPGQVRGSATFDGVDDIITVPHTDSVSLSSYTIGIWVRPEQLRAGRQTLLAKSANTEACTQASLDGTRNYYLGLEPMSTTVRFLAGRSINLATPQAPSKPACGTVPTLFNIVSKNALNLNQWNHVMAVGNGAGGALYINGILDSEYHISSSSYSPWTNDGPVEIGRLYNATAADSPFKGQIDEVQIYPSALGARAIKQAYDYQAAWFDFSTGTRLKIDAEPPVPVIDFHLSRVKSASDMVMCVAATDVTSGIDKLEYSEDGALWRTAEITSGVSLSLTQLSQPSSGCFVTQLVNSPGAKSVYARATDGAGTVSQPVMATFTVDGTGPVVALDAGLAVGAHAPSGNSVVVSGTVSDAGGQIASVTVALIEETGAATRGAISATLSGGRWQAGYPLPFTPHGVYTVVLRATDDVGNVTVRASDLITIDGFGPLADLTFGGSATRTLSSAGGSLPVITGTVSDVPYPSNTLLHLHFEEPSNAASYADGSSEHRGAACASACAQTPGVLGQAVLLDGTDTLFVNDPLAPSAGLTLSGYTFGLWVKPQTTAAANLIARRAGATGGVSYQLRINGAGRFELVAFDGVTRTVVSTATVVAGAWAHVAAAATSQGEMQLYVNGMADGLPLAVSALQGGGDQYQLGGFAPGAAGYFAGALDEAFVYGRALRAAEIHAIARPVASGAQSVEVGLRHVKDFTLTEDAGITWYPAALAQPGQRLSAWSFTLPEGVEGPFDISLRARDALGNERTALAAWTGDVDTLAPRVLLTTTIEGGRVRYTTTAQDYNLAAQGFNSACGADVTTGRRLYEADWYTRVISPDKGEIKEPEQTALRGKLFELSATCLLDAPPSMAETGAVPMFYPRAVVANANALYAFDVGVRVIAYDVSNPDRPIQQGAWLMPGAAGRLAVTGSLLLASTGTGIAIASIASPLQPISLGLIALANVGYVEDIAVAGQYVYAVAGQSGLRVIDLANPAAPVEIGALNTFSHAMGVAISGTLAVVADWYGRLRIVNIASPAAPAEIGHLDLPTFLQSVALRGSLAYVASYRGLEIVDISNPAAPFLVAQRALPGTGMRVVVSGTDAIVGLLDSGVAIVDVSNPYAPLLTRAFVTPVRAVDVAPRGGRIYVANLRAIRVLNPLLRPASIAVDTAGNIGRLVLPALTKAELAQLKSNPDAPLAEPDALSLQINSIPPLMSGAPYTLAGLAASTDGASLRTLSATVDGALIYTQSWSPGAALGIAWSGAWTPTGEGAHVVVLRAVDWVGASAVETASVVVDTLAPALGLSTTLFGLTQFGAQGAIDLRGLASDGSGIRDVLVRVDGQSLTATLDGANGWTARWQTGLGTLPDGLSVPIVITATDAVGRETVVSNGLLLDAAPPSAVAVSLSYTNSLGARVALAPGQTIYDVLTPTLLMTWTEALDGGGLSSYRAGWTGGVTLTAPELAGLFTTPPSGRDNAQAVGEARKVYAHVIATDLMGNQTESALGPVFVDYRRTDDYIRLDDAEGVYRGWMNSGCSLLGTDLRIGRSVQGTSPLRVPQSLYATWSAAALRLAWVGADWNRDGDLFVYLAGPGSGTTIAYNPYTPASAITLPMQATQVVWIRGANDMTFLGWTGVAWAELAWPGLVYDFTPDLVAPVTDLSIPFAALGVSNPASATLGLLAIAAESSPNGLRAWATAPRRNALNAARVVGLTEAEARSGDGYGNPTRAFALQLGANQCPQEDMYSGADLTLFTAATPSGRSTALYEDGWKSDDSNPQHPLIGLGDAIAYRFDIANLGDGPAINASIALTGDQIDLGNAPVGDHVWRLSISLGDVPAGATRTVTVTGNVNLAAGAARGGIVRLDSALVFSHSEYAGEPLLSQRSEHSADISVPTHLKLLPGNGLAGRGPQTIQGIVHDAGAVPTVTLEVQPPSGPTVTFTCPAAQPGGAWQCDWDAGSSPANDSVFQLRARATDHYGNTSGWTGWTSVIIDTQAATLTLGAGFQSALADGILSAADSTLDGRLDDNRQVSGIDVCQADGLTCSAATLSLDPFAAQDSFVYDDAPEVPAAISVTEQCLVGTPLLRTFTVSDAFTVTNVTLGLNATAPARAGLSVTLRSPAGTLVVLHAPGGTGGRDLDVLWDDAGQTALAGDAADHATGAPDYDNVRYPDSALGAFDGQPAAGVWTVSVCDTSSQTGAYNHAQLRLQRRIAPINVGATWSAALNLPNLADGISKTIVLNAYDLLGNHTDALTIAFTVDNVAPVLTLTAAAPTLVFTLGTEAKPVLTGTVLDGGHVKSVFVTIRTPSGDVVSDLTAGAEQGPGNRAASASISWRYDLQPNQSGEYALSITALDDAGNSTTIGPYAVMVTAVNPPTPANYNAFIPSVSRGPAPALQLPASEPETSAPDRLLIAGASPPRPRPRWGAWLLTNKAEPLFTQNGGSHE